MCLCKSTSKRLFMLTTPTALAIRRPISCYIHNVCWGWNRMHYSDDLCQTPWPDISFRRTRRVAVFTLFQVCVFLTFPDGVIHELKCFSHVKSSRVSADIYRKPRIRSVNANELMRGKHAPVAQGLMLYTCVSFSCFSQDGVNCDSVLSGN